MISRAKRVVASGDNGSYGRSGDNGGGGGSDGGDGACVVVAGSSVVFVGGVMVMAVKLLKNG